MGDNLDQIRLQKSRVQANLSDNLPLEDAEGNPEARGNWLNLSGLVSDIYHAFQFEPFSRKIVMLLKPINFNWPDGLRSLINKHVILRNCIQHHDGRLPAPFLKRWCEQHQEGHHGDRGHARTNDPPTMETHLVYGGRCRLLYGMRCWRLLRK